MTDIIAAQRQYFHTGATRPVVARKQALDKLEAALLRREGDLLSALQSDLGKAPFEGYATEVGLVLAELRDTRKHLGAWSRPRRVPMPLSQFPSTGRVCPEPYGVALIMAPWNYPVQLTLVPLISALAAGCTAVVKPSELAPATSAILASLLGETFPPEYVRVVEGGVETNTALLEERFDVIFFTGSPRVGKIVMAAAARHLTPVTLELGGKSPVIVCPDADLDLTARRLVWGKFLNAGQTCVAPDHVYVPAAQRDGLVRAMGKYIQKSYGDNPLDSPDLPRIVNASHFTRLLSLLDGGRVAFGGKSAEYTLKIEPTILTDVEENSPIMSEEIFGPLLPVLTYDSLDGLVAQLQSRERPLALYLFTRDKGTERRVLEALPFGGGCVNDTVVHLTASGLPFGGVGNSGMGACHGKAGFDAFTHQKSILKKGRLDVPVRYPPYQDSKIRLLKKLM